MPNRILRKGFYYARTLVLALVTPLLEKNRHKTAHLSRCFVPMVLSMSRLIVLAFAVGMLHQIVHAGVAGWPEATLSIAIVLALPLFNALERLKPEETVKVFKSVAGRFGEGAVRAIGNVYSTEPSKFDNHTKDTHDDRRDEQRRDLPAGRRDEPSPYREAA